MISKDDALHILASNEIALETETISIEKALNRTLAEDILSDRAYPPFNRATMDGFAVNTDWFNAIDQKRMPNQGVCLAGQNYTKKIDLSRSLRITTGASVPEGLDAVIRIEDAHVDCDMVTFNNIKTLKPWTNISKLGEDIAQGEVILKKGSKLTPQNLQALGTVGKESLKVYQQIKIALITTGDEVKNLRETVSDFQIRNSNYWSIKASLENIGIELMHFKHALDDAQIITQEINSALKNCNVLLLCGGVSMGEADFVPSCLKENGITQIFHKVAIKPGKPLWFGKNDNQAVFGLPGNPLSTFLDLHLFVLPYLQMIQGNALNSNPQMTLGNEQKSAPIDRYLPFQIMEGKAFSKPFNGSGDITSLINTDGFIHLKKDTLYEVNQLVEVILI